MNHANEESGAFTTDQQRQRPRFLGLEDERAAENGLVTAPVHGEDLVVEVLGAELLGSYENTSSVFCNGAGESPRRFFFNDLRESRGSRSSAPHESSPGGRSETGQNCSRCITRRHKCGQD